MTPVLGVVAGLLGLVPLIGNENPDTLFAASLALLLSASCGIDALLQLGWRRCFLGLCYSAFFAFTYPLSSILLYVFPQSQHPLLPADAGSQSLSLLVGGLGWLAFVAGYLLWARPQRTRDGAQRSGDCADYSWPLLVWMASGGLLFRVLVQLYAFSEVYDLLSRMGVAASVLANVGNLCTCALWSSPARRYRIASVVLILLYSVAGIFSGQRAAGFVPLLAFTLMVLLRNQSTHRVNRVGLGMLGALVLVLLILFPMLTRFKGAVTSFRGSVSGWARMTEARDAFFTTLDDSDRDTGSSSDEYLESFLKLATRFSHLQHGSVLVTVAEHEWGALHGKSLVDAVIQFVPRFLWHDKPTIGLGEEAYWLIGYQGIGAASIPVVVDCYLNFGFLGVALGMLLIGGLYATIDRHLAVNEPIRTALLALLTFHLTVTDNGIAGLVSTVVLNVLVAWGATLLIRSTTSMPAFAATAAPARRQVSRFRRLALLRREDALR